MEKVVAYIKKRAEERTYKEILDTMLPTIVYLLVIVFYMIYGEMRIDGVYCICIVLIILALVCSCFDALLLILKICGGKKD